MREDYKELQQKTPKPFRQLGELQQKIMELEAILTPKQREVSDIIRIMEEAQSAIQQNEVHQNWNACEVWDEIYKSGQQIVQSHLDHLAALKAQQEEAKKLEKEAKRAKKKQSARSAAAATSTNAKTGGSSNDIEPSDAGATDTNKEACTVLIGGKEVDVDDIFQPGTTSSRSRERAMKQNPKNKTSRKVGKVGAKMTQEELTKYLGESCTFTNPKNGTKHHMSDKKGQGIITQNDRLWCSTCEQAIPYKNKIGQHLFSAGHMEKLALKKKKDGMKQARSTHVVEDTRQYVESGAATAPGSTLSIECQQFRKDALRQALISNTSMSGLMKLGPVFDKYTAPDVSMGDARELPRIYSQDLRTKMMNQLRADIGNCFKDFATISDGTPVKAEAEAVKMRFVTKDFQIFEPLVSLKLFDVKLTGDNIANNLVKTIRQSAGCDPIYW